MNMNTEEKREGGFTLLELLIVIAIIAILSISLVFMLNPAETLRKARDTQRISDLKTIQLAIGVMMGATSTPSLDSTFSSTATGICTTRGDGTVLAGDIAYSSIISPTSGIDTTGGTDTVVTSAWSAAGATAISLVNLGRTDGAGWIPINLKAVAGGSTISNFPTDPINVGTLVASLSNYVYRYGCQNGSLTARPPFVFEINAQLESNAYTVVSDMRASDGGDHPTMYEIGSSLNLLPVGATVL